MEEFTQLGGGTDTRAAAAAAALMYFPSSSTSTPPPPPQSPHHQPRFFNPNSSHLQPKLEAGGGASSSHNPYGRPSFNSSAGHVHEDELKAKIVSHPHYSTLLGAYMDCQKVGASPDVAERLSAVAREIQLRQQASTAPCRRSAATADPELDQFMEAYCNMLVKYREERARPLQEAMDFLRRVESQLNSLTNGATASIFSTGN